MAGLAAAGCAPSSSDNNGAKEDKKSGKLRVWLFREVGNKPKEKVVDGVVDRFEKQHDGVTVDVQYIPVDSRAEKIKGAFNDPGSAPDVIEFGNTDTAGYVSDGGLADISAEFEKWGAAKDVDDTARKSVTVNGKIYGVPLLVGVRALYYRTDVFKELGLKPPRTLGEVARTAKKIRSEKPELYGLAVGGAYTYGAMPFLWANGGELARSKDGSKGGTFASALDTAASRKGTAAYTDLFGGDNCPAAKCAKMSGNDTVEAFAGGKAGMAIGGDFNLKAVQEGAVKGKYGVVPLPGVRQGEVAPAFAGGNNLGVLRSSKHRSLSVDLLKELAGKESQKKFFEGMGFLPTFGDTRKEAAAEEPAVAPFVKTLDAGTKFVPASPAWGEIDASLILPTMFQEIVSGKKSVKDASRDAARKMDEVFGK
ncbi:extracellular solute-binding protein [Streptomyces boncukensis]|uniref:Extracellular solute-binding protein n=1 Tax=Streptomyces boncukensis TaxID=2711219 RepID=A0A6G4X068_9ACTN|nr:extracellular solute-binding protein [Streptomyces boncukensis]NGO70936.1 extracellular solute-binding protein [Streptomyces boncukensis]